MSKRRRAAVVGMMLAGLAAAGCVPSRKPVQLPASVPVDQALSADIRYVFFTRGQTEVSADGSAAIAAAVLADARLRAKGGPAPRLTVTGHTDAGDNPAAAQRLSLRRAEAVAARLARAGIPPARIAVSAVGAADPLLPAPAGTTEPANDRVEIGFEPPNPAMSRLDATRRRPI